MSELHTFTPGAVFPELCVTCGRERYDSDYHTAVEEKFCEDPHCFGDHCNLRVKPRAVTTPTSEPTTVVKQAERALPDLDQECLDALGRIPTSTCSPYDEIERLRVTLRCRERQLRTSRRIANDALDRAERLMVKR